MRLNGQSSKSASIGVLNFGKDIRITHMIDTHMIENDLDIAREQT